MKTMLRALSLLGILAVVSCVTVNIYFPAEEVRNAADKIVNEVWGEQIEKEKTPPAPKKDGGSSLLRLLEPDSAYAAQDINVSTPEIRAIRDSMRQRSSALLPYLNGGNLGIGADGLLKVRSTEGLDLKARGEINRLMQAENQDRMRLYAEIARANGFPERAGEVQSIFADSWRGNASAGWFIEQGGGWARK